MWWWWWVRVGWGWWHARCGWVCMGAEPFLPLLPTPLVIRYRRLCASRPWCLRSPAHHSTLSSRHPLTPSPYHYRCLCASPPWCLCTRCCCLEARGGACGSLTAAEWLLPCTGGAGSASQQGLLPKKAGGLAVAHPPPPYPPPPAHKQAASRCSTSRACCAWMAGRGSRRPRASRVRCRLARAWVEGRPRSAPGRVSYHSIPPPPPSFTPLIAVLVRELRNEVSRLLAAKVADPSLDLSRSRVVEAMHHLLASDGF